MLAARSRGSSIFAHNAPAHRDVCVAPGLLNPGSNEEEIPMRALTATTLAVALAAILAVPAFAQDTKQDTKLDPKLVQRGEKVFAEQKCSMCHSIQGKGNKAGPLDNVGAKLTEEDIRQWMINPRVMTEKAKSTRKPLMPAYTKLPKEDLDAVIAYMRSLRGGK
jgi:mono/diheme cytochrome c family protein